jgi:hypothetical protein
MRRYPGFKHEEDENLQGLSDALKKKQGHTEASSLLNDMLIKLQIGML